MAPTYTTTAHGLRWLPGSNLASDIDAGFQALAEDVDTKLLTGGKSNISTTETVTSATYALATTPDRVQSVVLPTDGLILVLFQATWQNSVAGAGRAAIHLGTTAIKRAPATLPSGANPPEDAEATGPNQATVDVPVVSSPSLGLVSMNPAAMGSYSGDVTTGQLVGINGTASGPVYIFAAAGTYDVSVRYKSASGTVTVKNRKLWIRVLAP